MKGLSSQQILELNKDHDRGIFFEGLIVTKDMNDTESQDYFCNFQRAIEFNGHVYTPQGMSFDDAFSMSSSMELPVCQINLINIGGVVDAYLHDPSVHVRRNDIVMQILHIDDEGVVTEFDRDKIQVQVIHGQANAGVATIFAGLNMRLDDRVPRETMETNEFPGIRADVIRSGTS